jgi:hypothetical protein
LGSAGRFVCVLFSKARLVLRVAGFAIATPVIAQGQLIPRTKNALQTIGMANPILSPEELSCIKEDQKSPACEKKTSFENGCKKPPSEAKTKIQLFLFS